MTNIWHWSLSLVLALFHTAVAHFSRDTSCGQMLLALGEGRLSSEVKSTGLSSCTEVNIS